MVCVQALGYLMMLSIFSCELYAYHNIGCVTPKQLTNIKDAIDGDFDLLDGFDELPEEDQARVRQALDSGHIAEEDVLHLVSDLNNRY